MTLTPENTAAIHSGIGIITQKSIRIKIIAADGASNYIRVFLNKLSEEEFKEFIKYHLTTCERSDLLGASAHLLDIVRK